MVVHALNSAQVTKAGESLEFDQGQPDVQNEFQDSQGYSKKPFPKKQNTNKKIWMG